MADFKKNTVKAKFINPFEKGVTYNDFLKAVGKKTVAEYCKGKLTSEEINWLTIELVNYKQNKKDK